ncbi:31253_t:CDS:2, partial [Gigaspora margarita]
LFTTQEVFTEYLIDDDEFIHVIYDDEMLENVNHAVEEMNDVVNQFAHTKKISTMYPNKNANALDKIKKYL